MFTVSACLVSLAAACLPVAEPADVTQAVARKLDMRGDYHLRLRLESRRPPPDTPARWAYTAEMWRAGDKFRVDLFDAEADPVSTGQPGYKSRHVTCQNCEQPGRVVVTTVYPGKPAVTSMVGFHTSTVQSPEYTTLNIDWRFFGLCNTRLSLYNTIPITKSYQELAANPELRVSRQSRGDRPCLVASLAPEKQFDIWFDEADRLNPVLHSAAHGGGATAGRTTTEVGWRPTAGGHLYPSLVTHTQTKGGAVQYEEALTVLHADFHNPVDPAVFTLGGMGLNERQQIALPGLSPEDQPRWRNGKADPSLSSRASAEARRAAGPGVPPRPLAPYPEGGLFLVLSVVFGVVALAAFAAAIVYRRRRGA